MEQCSDERIMVTFVEDGSPARKQGINVDDEVIEVNGQNLREINNSFNDILEVMNSRIFCLIHLFLFCILYFTFRTFFWVQSSFFKSCLNIEILNERLSYI